MQQPTPRPGSQARPAIRGTGTDLAHTGEILFTGGGSWWAICSCGWLSKPDRARDRVATNFAEHAPGAPLVETLEADEPFVPSHGEAMPAGRARHQQMKSEMVAVTGGVPRFRARCACGWVSPEVPMGLAFAIWDEHFGSTR